MYSFIKVIIKAKASLYKKERKINTLINFIYLNYHLSAHR